MAKETTETVGRLAREEHQSELHTRDAISRRDESRANVLRGRANRMGDQFQKPSKEASDEALASAKAAEELRGSVPPIDPEGTSPGLSDRSGNFAANAEVAAAGGIGVDSSNTNIDTGEPAVTGAEAGVITETGPAVVFGHGGAGVPLRTADDADDGGDGDDADDGADDGIPRRRKTAAQKKAAKKKAS